MRGGYRKNSGRPKDDPEGKRKYCIYCTPTERAAVKLFLDKKREKNKK